MCPAYLPSSATWITVPALRQGMYFTPSLRMSLSFPAATATSSTVAVTPWPLISSMSRTRLRSGSRP